MSRDLLREYVCEVLRETRSTLSSQNMNDIGLALNWIRLHGKIRNARGHQPKTLNGRHVVTISHSGSKKELKDLVKARFGSFIDVD